MQFGLRAKLTMVMAGLVLLSTAVLSLVFAELLMQQMLHDTDKRATELSRETFDAAVQAVEDARAKGLRPASEDAQDTRDYLTQAFEMSEGLDARMGSASDSPWIYEIAIVDRNDVVLASTDSKLAGKTALRHPPFSQLVQSPFVRQVRLLLQQATVYEVDFPFKLRGEPYGDVRV